MTLFTGWAAEGEKTWRAGLPSRRPSPACLFHQPLPAWALWGSQCSRQDRLPRQRPGGGCTFPRGKPHPALTLPGPSYQGCPPNPRPRMFNQQIHFHRKAAGFESLLLKSKQNTEALPKSLERESLPAPAVLPRRGAALAKLRLFVFHSIFQNCLFPPFRILLQAFALLLFTQTLSSRGLLPRQAWGLHPWTGAVWGLLGPKVTLPHGEGG